MVVVEATGPNARMTLDRTVAHSGATPAASSESATGRPFLVRVLPAFAVLATVVWLVAAPSTPALIAVVSALIAVIGWGDGPDSDLSV